MISSLMFIWLRFTLPQFASYLSSFQTDPSQICINCGKNNHRLGLDKSEWLDVREWDCPNCGTRLDRDINAAQVILKKGLATQ